MTNTRNLMTHEDSNIILYLLSHGYITLTELIGDITTTLILATSVPMEEVKPHRDENGIYVIPKLKIMTLIECIKRNIFNIINSNVNTEDNAIYWLWITLCKEICYKFSIVIHDNDICHAHVIPFRRK